MSNAHQPKHFFTRRVKIAIFLLAAIIIGTIVLAGIEKYQKDQQAEESQKIEILMRQLHRPDKKAGKPSQLPDTWAGMMTLKEEQDLSEAGWEKVALAWLEVMSDDYESGKRSYVNFYSDYDADDVYRVRQLISSTAANYNEGAKTIDAGTLRMRKLPPSLDENPVLDP